MLALKITIEQNLKTSSMLYRGGKRLDRIKLDGLRDHWKRKCATKSKRDWRSRRRDLHSTSEYVLTPRHKDLESGTWTTAHSSRNKRVSRFMAVTSESYSPLFTKFGRLDNTFESANATAPCFKNRKNSQALDGPI
jgi:hypothetical protein